ncbi:MAG TPA: hypothetical protein VMB91_04045 [Solirubrobacteraceae bacterium]|nr:hypothetical protein [Solirubrobacteraceae bacterium]
MLAEVTGHASTARALLTVAGLCLGCSLTTLRTGVFTCSPTQPCEDGWVCNLDSVDDGGTCSPSGTSATTVAAAASSGAATTTGAGGATSIGTTAASATSGTSGTTGTTSGVTSRGTTSGTLTTTAGTTVSASSSGGSTSGLTGSSTAGTTGGGGCTPAPSPPAVVETAAGDGNPGFVNGSSPEFASPMGVAADAYGGFYVADTANNAIRYVESAGGSAVTFAGDGDAGFAEWPGGALGQLSGPRGLALGPATFGPPGEALYIADTDNNAIRGVLTMMAPELTTLAGDGDAGYVDGPVAQAQFHRPGAVAVDDAGTIYVADSFNNAIRKISGGQVTTIAGDGDAGFANGRGNAAQFSGPTGIAVDSQGILYVADYDNGVVREIDLAGNVTTLAGTPGTYGWVDGPATTAKFYQPWGIAVDDGGVVYVSDTVNEAIRMIVGGMVYTVAGNGMEGLVDGDGACATAPDELAFPSGIALGTLGSQTLIYVSDVDNNAIRTVELAPSGPPSP